jgi:hypothetical protein
MGKPKKGGYPPPQPSTRFVSVKNGEIENKTIAWGDSVVWENKDNVPYTLVLLAVNGNPAATPAPVWATLTAVGTVDANSSPRIFGWPGAPPKDPYVYQYGMQDPPNAKATLTVQISV